MISTGFTEQQLKKFPTLRRFQVNSDFMIKWGRNVLTATFPFLPKGVNISFGYHPDHSTVNVHLTNELNQDDKPQIKICEMDRKDFFDRYEEWSFHAIARMFKPLDIEQYKKEETYFLSFNDLQKNRSFDLLWLQLSKSLSPSIRKWSPSRIKMKGDFGQTLDDFAAHERNKQIIDDNATLLSKYKSNGHIEGGFLVSEKSFIAVNRLFDRWYTLKELHDVKDMLRLAISEEKVEAIMNRYEWAKEKIVELKTRQESLPYNKDVVQLKLVNSPAKEDSLIDYIYQKAYEIAQN